MDFTFRAEIEVHDLRHGRWDLNEKPVYKNCFKKWGAVFFEAIACRFFPGPRLGAFL
jgi:hypothetical protein